MQVPFFNDWDVQTYTLSGFFDNDKTLARFTKAEMDLLLHGKDRKFKAKFGGKTINRRWRCFRSARRSCASYRRCTTLGSRISRSASR